MSKSHKSASDAHAKVKSDAHVKVMYVVSKGNAITTARGLLSEGGAIRPYDVSSPKAFDALIASGCVVAI